MPYNSANIIVDKQSDPDESSMTRELLTLNTRAQKVIIFLANWSARKTDE